MSNASPNNAGFTTGWQFCQSLWPQNSYPQNGNYQMSNSDQTRPQYWDWTINSSSRISITYVDTGGVFGNRSVRLRTNWNDANPGVTDAAQIYSTAVHPTRPLLPAHVTYWKRLSSTPPTGLFAFRPHIDYYSDDAGTSLVGSVELQIHGDTETDATTWTFAHYGEDEAAMTANAALNAAARTMRLRLVIDLAAGSGFSSGDRDLFLDDFIIDWYEPGVSP